MESEMVNSFSNWKSVIDMSYYKSMVDEAVNTINKYGDIEWFVSDDHLEITNKEKEITKC